MVTFRLAPGDSRYGCDSTWNCSDICY